jgi:glutamate dehydrogenase (NAD(P)+)
VQDQQKLSWDGAEVRRRLEAQLRAALGRVADAGERLEVGWRTAAQAVAVERIATASRMRAIYP